MLHNPEGMVENSQGMRDDPERMVENSQGMLQNPKEIRDPEGMEEVEGLSFQGEP